jgi:hypothetical protein
MGSNIKMNVSYSTQLRLQKTPWPQSASELCRPTETPRKENCIGPNKVFIHSSILYTYSTAEIFNLCTTKGPQLCPGVWGNVEKKREII